MHELDLNTTNIPTQHTSSSSSCTSSATTTITTTTTTNKSSLVMKLKRKQIDEDNLNSQNILFKNDENEFNSNDNTKRMKRYNSIETTLQQQINTSIPVQSTPFPIQSVLKTDSSTSIDHDLLGPCKSGTPILLEGIVWNETTKGVLVLNVTWKGKTFIGALLDSTKNKGWAPPMLKQNFPKKKQNNNSTIKSINPSIAACIQSQQLPQQQTQQQLSQFELEEQFLIEQDPSIRTLRNGKRRFVQLQQEDQQFEDLINVNNSIKQQNKRKSNRNTTLNEDTSSSSSSKSSNSSTADISSKQQSITDKDLNFIQQKTSKTMTSTTTSLNDDLMLNCFKLSRSDTLTSPDLIN